MKLLLFIVFSFFREDLLHRGFMLVLDRRREKWGTVKSCLSKVQVCWILLYFHFVLAQGELTKEAIGHSTGRPIVTQQYFALRLSCGCCCFFSSLEPLKFKKCLQSGAFDMTCIVFNWRVPGKNVLTDILGLFFIFAQKWLIFCMWPNSIKEISVLCFFGLVCFLFPRINVCKKLRFSCLYTNL